MNLKRYDLIAIIFFTVILTLVGVQSGFSFTGTNDVISPGALEITSINATNYYLDDVSINERLTGDWGSVNLETTGYLNASEFYRNGLNYTAWVESLGGGENPFDQDLNTTDAVDFVTVNTGHGDNELYDMDQHVLEASAVTFATLDTGHGANELYDMDQHVLEASSVTFATVDTGGLQTTWLDLDGVNRTTWPTGGGASGPNGSYFVTFLSDLYIVINRSTGETVFSVANADDVFNWIDGNTTKSNTFYLSRGIYNFANMDIDNDIKIYANDGVVFNLTESNESMDFHGKAYFENIEWYSVVDGVFHVMLRGDTEFIDNNFTFPMELSSENQGIFRMQGPDKILLDGCTLTAGFDGCENWELMVTRYGSVEQFIVRDFTVENIICNGTPGRISVFVFQSDSEVEYAEFENILVKTVSTTYMGSTFLYVGDIEMLGLTWTNYKQWGGIWTDADSYFDPCHTTGNITYVTITDMELRERFHPVFHAHALKASGLRLIGDGETASFDLGTQKFKGGEAIFDDIFVENGSLDMNTGWKRFVMTNFLFNGSRLWIGDEGPDTGQKKTVLLSNGLFTRIGASKRNTALQTNFGQGINLHFKASNVDFETTYVMAAADPSYPTFFHFDQCYIGPLQDFSNPRFNNGAARDNDNVKVWLTDCNVTTYNPPFNDWNPIRINDRIINTMFFNTSTETWSYSECFYNWTIQSGSSSVTVTHDLPMRGPTSYYLLTLTSDTANCTGVYSAWVDFDNDQVIIRAYDAGAEKNVNSDVTGIITLWLTKPTP